MAFLSEGVPPAGVYLVSPLLIAAIAASLMNCGVSKSGSPAPIAITSLPSAFRRAALAETARVGEALMAWRRVATRDIAGFSGQGWKTRCVAPILPCRIFGLPAQSMDVLTFPNSPFRLHRPFEPAGDQPQAIDKLV